LLFENVVMLYCWPAPFFVVTAWRPSTSDGVPSQRHPGTNAIRARPVLTTASASMPRTHSTGAPSNASSAGRPRRTYDTAVYTMLSQPSSPRGACRTEEMLSKKTSTELGW
jgi:hypothetical protein